MKYKLTKVTADKKEFCRRILFQIEAPADCYAPKIGSKYYYIISSTLIRNMYANIQKRIWNDDEADRTLRDKNNCFRSRKEAEFVYKSLHGKF